MCAILSPEKRFILQAATKNLFQVNFLSQMLQTFPTDFFLRFQRENKLIDVYVFEPLISISALIPKWLVGLEFNIGRKVGKEGRKGRHLI